MEYTEVIGYMVQALEPILPESTLQHIKEKQNAALYLFDALLGAYLDLKAMPLVSNTTYNTILLREKNMQQMQQVIDNLYAKFTEYKEGNDEALCQLKDKVRAKNQQLQQLDERIYYLQTENNMLQNSLNSNQFTIARLTEENTQISVLQEDNYIIYQSVNEMSKQAEAFESTIADMHRQKKDADFTIQELKIQLQEVKSYLQHEKEQSEFLRNTLEAKIQTLNNEKNAIAAEFEAQKRYAAYIESSVYLNIGGLQDIQKELEQNKEIHALQDEISALKQYRMQLEDYAIQYTASIGYLILENNELKERMTYYAVQKAENAAELQETKYQLAAQQKLCKELYFDAQKIKQQRDQLDNLVKTNQALESANYKYYATAKQLQQEYEYLQRYYQYVMLENRNYARKIEELQLGQANQAEGVRAMSGSLLAVLATYHQQIQNALEPGALTPTRARAVTAEYANSCDNFADLLGEFQLLQMDECAQAVKKLTALFSTTTAAKTLALSQMNVLAQTYKMDFEEGEVVDVQISSVEK